MTKTSSFGTSRRENHDSTTFYQRELYKEAMVETEPFKVVKTHISISQWADRIYHETSENMKSVPDNSIALAFTSPPYNVGKDYDENMSLGEYLHLIQQVGKEVYRVLVPGGRYVINIANLGRKPYIPLHFYIYEIHNKVGFMPMGEIIWQKAKGANGNCAWGSWNSAKSPRLRDVHEYLIIFAKKRFSRPDKGISDITPQEFMESTLSVWHIAPESAKRVGHPAPFPVELASRVIKLYSYVGDVILDPFTGSGTTCVAAVKLNRHYVGYDIDAEYIKLAEQRINVERSTSECDDPGEG